jgi:ABC-type polysaccharide/polyol phosphate export permease
MDVSRTAAPSFSTSASRPGPIGLVREAVSELWSRRQLVRYLVQADLKKKGADSLLGNLWWVFDPLLQMLVYVILVVVIFDRKQVDYPLFIFAAILPWKWFTAAVNDSIVSVSSQDRLIKQVRFPKIVLPAAAVSAGVVNFAFGMVPLIILTFFWYPARLTPFMLLVPVIAIVQLVFSLAIGLVVSTINVFYRDIANISRHALRLWFYLSPALYGVSTIKGLSDAHPELYRLMQLNPFFTLFNAYRIVIYGQELPGGLASPPTWPDWTSLGILFVVSLILLMLATVFFKRIEPTFAKVL